MKGLHLFDNSFSGIVSEEIGTLKDLTFLRAQNNVLSGYIPYGLESLKKLRQVYLYQNQIYGPIPVLIGDMEDLEDLRLHENEMTGVIPESLYQVRKLKNLWLQDTLRCDKLETGRYDCSASSSVGFEGTISTQIGNLKKLQRFLINNNPLTGYIPTEIGLCEDLAVVHMHQTNIEGTAPREMCLLRDKKLNSES